MTQVPLFFSFAQPVFGNGFVAGVRMKGRALLEDEGEETWITGVDPVGIAASGADRGEAFTAFKNAWASVLFDIAAESTSFGTFHDACAGFLSAGAATVAREWERALQEVRRLGYRDPTLKSQPADGFQATFEVVDLTAHFNPSQNEVEQRPKIAA